MTLPDGSSIIDVYDDVDSRAHTRTRDDGDNGQPVRKRHAPSPNTTERQTRIDEIKGLLAAVALAPRDMFLTQPSAPARKHEKAYAAWQERERRRRPIAHRLALYGLTAHDLAPRGRP